jgi:hypothetical protein
MSKENMQSYGKCDLFNTVAVFTLPPFLEGQSHEILDNLFDVKRKLTYLQSLCVDSFSS